MKYRTTIVTVGLPLLLVSLAGMTRADVTINSGTASEQVGGPNGRPDPVNIQISGPNGSVTVSNLNGQGPAPMSGSLISFSFTPQNITFNPTISVQASDTTFANVSFGTTSCDSTPSASPAPVSIVQMNFVGSPVTVPNNPGPSNVSAPYYAFGAAVSNIPFTMTGTITCTQGLGGPVLFTSTISGSGIYSAQAVGDSYNGAGPGTHVTYQFQPVPLFTQDTATQGSWNGKYGADGYLIPNGATLPPSYASVSTSASTYTWAWSTTDVRALQNGKGSTSRIASTYIPANYGTSYSVNVNLTDGKTHQVALYLVDWDSTSRSETVTITDAATNTVIDKETIGNFHGGTYAVWNLSGNVNIAFTGTGGNPVLSGIFFDSAPTAPQPSFSLSATAATATAGQSGSSTISVVPANGFNSAVTLTFSPVYSGVTGTFGTNPTTGSSTLTINVPSNFPAGNYQLSVSGTSGSLSATTSIPLTVTAAPQPSFTLSATAATATAGSSGTSTVTVTPANGFNSAVTLAVSNWPSGITGTFGTNPATGSSTVTINVASNVAAGPYSLTVTGSAGARSATTAIALTVNAAGLSPGFTINATPAAVTVVSGVDSQFTTGSNVTVTPLNGFNGAVTFSTPNWPAGIFVIYRAAGGNPFWELGVRSGVAPGSYSLPVVGTSGLLTATTNIPLTVTASNTWASLSSSDTATEGAWIGKYGSDGYMIANGPTQLPSYAAVNITGASTYTWAQHTSDPRALQIPGGSAGIASCYYGNSMTFNVNLTDGKPHRVALYILDFDTTSRVEAISAADAVSGVSFGGGTGLGTGFHNGQYLVWNMRGNVTITVTTVSGGNAVASGLFFDTPSLGFSLGASINYAQAGASTPAQVFIQPTNGFNPSVTLATSNWPAGITGTFGTNPTTDFSVLTINVASNVAPGSYSLTIVGTSGSQTVTGQWTLVVNSATPVPPGFTLSAPSASLTSGTSATITTVSVSPVGGFNSPVTLSTANWPAGITGTFLLNPTTVSSGVTISVASNVAPGSYSLTVNGSGGGLSASTTISLTVTAPAPPPSFTLSATAASVAAGSIGTSTIAVIPANGFNSAVTLSTSGWPTGITGTFGANPATASSVLTISVSVLLSPGGTATYPLTITGVSGSLTASTTLVLTVTNAPSGTVAYLGLDTTTKGAWTGVYGAGGYLIANDTLNPPPSARQASVIGASTFTWAPSTTDPRALQSAPNSATGIASTYTQYPNTSFTIHFFGLNTLELYLLDWDGGGSRTETITISDAITGAVLDSRTFSSFQNGVYAKWSTPPMYLTITVTPAQGTTPVVSGVFFN